MRRVEVKLKLISQLISFGADKDKKEFRITELKSLLRSTFRELYYFKDEDDMRKKEAYLFGSTENKAPVSMIYEKDDNSCEGKSEKLFDEGTEFTVCFVERKSKKDCMDFLEFYINLLSQASIIGGIGQSSSIGKGAFRIVEIKDLLDRENEEFNKFIPKNLEEVEKIISDTKYNYLDEDKEPIKLRTVLKKERNITYSNLNSSLQYPYVININIIQLNDSQKIGYLMKEINKLYKKIRREMPNNIGKDENNSEDSETKRYISPFHFSFAASQDKKFLIIKEKNYNFIFDKSCGGNDIQEQEIKRNVDEFIEKTEK